MANLFTVPAGKLNAFTGKLAEAGLTAEIVLAADTNPDIVKAMVEAAQKIVEASDRNPFEQTVEEQIAALRRANHEEGWGIPDETFNRLAKTAPEWPKGKDSYRSFRIRLGEGDDGVAKTFEAHVARIKQVHGDTKLWRWDLLLSGKHPYRGEEVERLRLLSGNATHKPVVEWIIIDLDANRTRKSIEAVRGPKSLADEGLVLAWLFPERTQAIDYDKLCAWYCAGYELNVPEDGGSWRYVPCVHRYRDAGEVSLFAYWHVYDFSDYSVPVFGE
jgi:hypothetical protein